MDVHYYAGVSITITDGDRKWSRFATTPDEMDIISSTTNVQYLEMK